MIKLLLVYSPHGFVLHTCISSLEPSQSLPWHDGAGRVHVRFRLCTPEPHSFEHVDHSDQGVNFPSIGQQWTLHDCVACKFAFAQLSVDLVLYWRVWCRWPPPHGNEHSDHGLQSVKSHVQLTPLMHGHGSPVQGNVSIISLEHNEFGCDESVIIKLFLRISWPVWPHEATHLLQSHHEVYSQSSLDIELLILLFS